MGQRSGPVGNLGRGLWKGLVWVPDHGVVRFELELLGSWEPQEQAAVEVMAALRGFAVAEYLVLLVAVVPPGLPDVVVRDLVDAILDSLVCAVAQFGNHWERSVLAQLPSTPHCRPGSSNCVLPFPSCSGSARSAIAKRHSSCPTAMHR